MAITDFTDEEDRALVQSAKVFTDKGEKVHWKEVEKRMKYTKKPKYVLCERLKTLKKKYGKDLNCFPPRFTALTRARPNLPRRCKPPAITDVILASKSLLLLASDTKHVREIAILDENEAIAAVTEVFAAVTKATIRQCGKRVDLNAGELSVAGVAKLISCLGTIGLDDVFVDLGSGLGNVVAQVALQTSVGKCIGIEIREDVVATGKRLLKEHSRQLPHLQKVDIVVGDIRQCDSKKISKATIVYSSNQLFAPDTLQVMEQLVCDLKNLRFVVLTAPFCYRHRDGCRREFCMLWQLHKTIEVFTSWTSTPVSLYIYTAI